ncbi:hypothetical protein J8F10_19205 [Gemmata sp. G18]|uniref:DUF4337 domain-containing protein n=1 Tax=Gemmata palustris TaxID=2822762 RepID=A0ABS5BUL4_9BACT|nr:hypothetical protein [Gemmata palustris]MBP3957379.1 hypothetical protein [Gemmata palustris]
MADDAPAPNPDDKKPEEPKSLIEKAGAALPIALTALATVFASMSNGALQEAMYWKSQAAQDQSKSTNQWSLAGFKRDRALIMQATATQLRALSNYAPAKFDVTLKDVATPEELQKARAWLTERGEKGGPPPAKLPDIEDEKIKELREAIEHREPERDLLKKAGRVEMVKITKAIDDAEKYTEHTDKEWTPTLNLANGLVRAQLAFNPDAADAAKKSASATAAQAVGFDLEERRYRAESRLNQGIGFLYEIRTKVSAAESDKHRKKSEFLSYAMLVAQIGAVASSLALARKQKNVLWLFAAMVGLVSVVVGGYAFIPPALLPF